MGATDSVRIPDSLTTRQLVAAVEGRSGLVSEGEALKELARRRVPRRSELLTTVVVDATQSPNLRAVAAVELGREVNVAHQEALTVALASRDPVVTRRAAESLGRIGDERALEALKKVRSRIEPVRQSLAFAKSLISYRLGLRQYRLKPPAPGELLQVQRQRAVPLQAREAEDEIEAIGPTLRRELPAIAVATDGALGFGCGRNTFLLVLVRIAAGGPAVEELTGRNAVPAVLLKRSPSLDRYTIYEYVFTHPAPDDRLHIFGVRTTGIIGHYGTAEIVEDAARFAVKAVRTPYSPPVLVEGVYDLRKRAVRFGVALVYPELTVGQRSKARPAKLVAPMNST
jgi:hypothetical protein